MDAMVLNPFGKGRERRPKAVYAVCMKLHSWLVLAIRKLCYGLNVRHQFRKCSHPDRTGYF